jgi:hypothetical protein
MFELLAAELNRERARTLTEMTIEEKKQNEDNDFLTGYHLARRVRRFEIACQRICPVANYLLNQNHVLSERGQRE